MNPKKPRQMKRSIHNWLAKRAINLTAVCGNTTITGVGIVSSIGYDANGDVASLTVEMDEGVGNSRVSGYQEFPAGMGVMRIRVPPVPA